MKHTISRQQISTEEYHNCLFEAKEYSQELDSYLDQLLWWNKRLNLVSRNVPRETIWKHIQHSLIINQFTIFSECKFIIDAGTGGGLPGIPLAIMNPDKQFLLNDIVTKKALAVRQMAQHLGLKNIEVKDASVKDLIVQEPFLLVSKHAFKINSLFTMTRHMPWTELVFYKGLDFEEELEGIEDPLSISVYNFPEQLDELFYKDKGIVIVSRSPEQAKK